MANKKLHFIVVDDDKIITTMLASLLEAAGHKVTTFNNSSEAIAKIPRLAPDCILSDLKMPDLDGFQLYHQLKEHFPADKKKPLFIVITSKPYEFDRQQLLALGVEGYLSKTTVPKDLIAEIFEIIDDQVSVSFWGIRGTFPVPGKNTVRYGGNTSCVSLQIAKKHFFIFDAGTGLRPLSNYLLANNKLPLTAKIFITHPHWDHIQGIPYFVPLYMKGNDFQFFGAGHSDSAVEKLLSDQMNCVHFPVTVKEFSANLSFTALQEETITLDDVTISTQLLNHPGQCLGYRVAYKNKLFCYVTDNELYHKDSKFYNQFEEDKLIRFIHKADLIVIDCTYTDEEYLKRIHWGHSCISRVIEVCHQAEVKKICLFHHDIDQLDKDIDMKLKTAKDLLKRLHSKRHCIAPKEGQQIVL